MGKRIDPEDFIGKKFGSLTPVEYLGKEGKKHYYRCNCDCGKSTVVWRDHLRNGAIKSCGCKNYRNQDLEDIIGQKFGRLTVLEYEGLREPKVKGRRKSSYLCRCDCGKDVSILRNELLSGTRKSCGDCTAIVREGDHYRYFDYNGRSFIFDEEDLELVKSRRWRIVGGYVSATPVGEETGKILLHRLIVSAEDDDIVDHIDRDPSNNRRSNLRLADKYDNMHNMKLNCRNTTGFKGVYMDKRNGRFVATLQNRGETVRLGSYKTKEEAARAYDEAARFYFGEFACVNFPREGERGCRPAEVFPMFDIYEDFEELDAVI